VLGVHPQALYSLPPRETMYNLSEMSPECVQPTHHQRSKYNNNTCGWHTVAAALRSTTPSIVRVPSACSLYTSDPCTRIRRWEHQNIAAHSTFSHTHGTQSHSPRGARRPAVSDWYNGAMASMSHRAAREVEGCPPTCPVQPSTT
jgi:hypothetical protein